MELDVYMEELEEADICEDEGNVAVLEAPTPCCEDEVVDDETLRKAERAATGTVENQYAST
jgi:hypothetical protein